MPHRPGPRAAQGGWGGIAQLQDLEGGDQLTLKKRTAPPVIGQRGERVQGGNVAAHRAIGAFQPPDGGDDFGVNAIGGLDPGQRFGLGFQGLKPMSDAVLRDGGVKIFPDRLGEFVLVAVVAHDLW